MISNDFTYSSPKTRREAIRLYRKLKKSHDKISYYGGGSEIISMARVNNNAPDAIIDIKNIPECNVLEIRGNYLIIGSAVSLNRIEESKLFPLLGTTASRIADHTNQCRITLGGNICGTIIYKETVLPLLLSNALISIYGPRGLRIVPFDKVFNKRINLNKGEFIYQFKIKKDMLNLPYTHIKKTANEKIESTYHSM
jgi:CO/xanthine dehydrogenase FAD-binding subunit